MPSFRNRINSGKEKDTIKRIQRVVEELDALAGISYSYSCEEPFEEALETAGLIEVLGICASVLEDELPDPSLIEVIDENATDIPELEDA